MLAELLVEMPVYKQSDPTSRQSDSLVFLLEQLVCILVNLLLLLSLRLKQHICQQLRALDCTSELRVTAQQVRCVLLLARRLQSRLRHRLCVGLTLYLLSWPACSRKAVTGIKAAL